MPRTALRSRSPDELYQAALGELAAALAVILALLVLRGRRARDALGSGTR
jgi:hypothetical protein